MADTVLVGRNFDLGFVTDEPRDQLPRGAAYRLKDYIPRNGAPVDKRGGWSHASVDLNALSPATRMSGLAWAPFPQDPHLIALSEAGKLYQVKAYDGTGGVFIADTSLAAQTHSPIWHKDRMIVLQALGAPAANPKKYYDSGGLVYASADLGGTPPQARTGFSWGEYLALGNGYVGGTLYANRLWFSGIANSESWNTSGGFHGVPVEELVVATPLRNVILAWGASQTWMITGDTPPPGGNLANRLLYGGNGCMDGRSLALWREYAIWANNSGIWKSDGSVLSDLATKGGISSYWRDLVSEFNFKTGWSAAAGILYGHYIITIFDNNGAYVTTLACNIEQETWFECRNINAAMYAYRSSGPGTATADGHEELFFANRSIPRVEFMSSCWEPTSSVAMDADGEAVLPSIETGFYKMSSPALKRIRRVYITHDIRSAGGSPRLDVGMTTSPEGSTYTDLTPSLPATTKQERKAIEVRRKELGVAFKIDQVGASATTSLAEIELEGHALESSR